MTGEPAQPSPEANYYKFRRQHSELDKAFNTEMAQHTIRATQSILDAYDFHSLRNVADIGGGHGSLLAAILNSYPSHMGILFDQPHVTNDALHYLEKAGVAERCRIVEGDFFNRIPDGADILILKNILHNWNDERSIAILRNCRKALDKGGKILLVERLMPTRARDNSDTIWLDLCMLVQTGGQERTKDEYCRLLAAAGFLFTRDLPTASPLWVIEAVRADDRTE
jgi:SAM-dependent methyltransferase